MQLRLRYAKDSHRLCQRRLLDEWLRDVYAPVGKKCWHSEGESMTSLQIRNESDRARVLGHIAGMDITKPKKLAITEVDRSGEQNKALHAALADIAAQVEHAGKKWDVLIWKRLLTAAWLRESGDKPQMIPAVDGNGFDVIYERTSKLTVKQCAELIEWVHCFGAEHQVRWTQKDNWGWRY